MDPTATWSGWAASAPPSSGQQGRTSPACSPAAGTLPIDPCRRREHTRATVGDIEVEYVLTGPEDGTPIVLICGLLQPLTLWPSVFTATLAAAGFRVLTFDNRDAGLSSYETRPAPDLAAVLGGDLWGVNYTLSDMAADAVGVIREIGWETAHVLGHSMGSDIASRVAIEHHEAVRTLTLFAGKPLDGRHGGQSPEFLEALLTPTPDDDAGTARTCDGQLPGLHRARAHR